MRSGGPIITQSQLTPAQADVLREVTNIGAAHAATALSQMVGQPIMIRVPRIESAERSDIPGAVGGIESPVMLISLHTLGDFTGETLITMPLADARTLAGILLHRPPAVEPTLGTLEESAIQEVGNILASAYLNALADFMGMMLLPSVPRLVHGSPEDALARSATNAETLALVVHTQMVMSGERPLEARFLMLPGAGTLERILEQLGVAR